jgi:hypothetical protein
MPQIQDCKRELRYLLSKPNAPAKFIEVNAGELHQRVFGALSEDAAVCCAAMRSELHEGDQITAGAANELSAVFTVRYALPRPKPVVQADAQD